MNQCRETKGMYVEMEMSDDVIKIRKSSDFTLVENEIETVKSYAESLKAIKQKHCQRVEAKLEKALENTEPSSVKKNAQKPKFSENPNIWIPSRDTLLSI